MVKKNLDSEENKSWHNALARAYTSSFGIGFLPKAPGTFGSLVGMVLGVCLHKISLSAAISILAILTAISIIAIRVVEKNLRQHDPSEIVIDEVIGQSIAVLFINPNPLNVLLVFVLFRLFDIWKPGPVGWVDKKVPGAIGTMADDFTAALIAGILALQITKFLGYLIT